LLRSGAASGARGGESKGVLRYILEILISKISEPVLKL
jgi:hypothetical protein